MAFFFAKKKLSAMKGSPHSFAPASLKLLEAGVGLVEEKLSALF